MVDYLEGWLGTAQAGVEARNDLTVAIRNWFANLNPFITRFPNVPVDRVDFTMFGHRYRGRSFSLSSPISSNATTTFVLNDATSMMNHDVLQVVDSSSGNVEFVQVNSDTNNGGTASTSTNVTVLRGSAGTSALSSIAAGSPVTLIGNSRTGAEVNQLGLSTVPYLTRVQYCQTFQFPVQVGGSAQTTRAAVLPGGLQSPFDFNRTMQLQNMCNDIEYTAFYGLAQAPADNANAQSIVTAKCNGIRNILTTNNISGTNKPINSTAYGPNDLVRDTLQASRKGGGEANVLYVSTDWMSAFAMWGFAAQRIPAGETQFGTPIEVLECPFLNGVAIVEAPLLNPGTAVCFTASEVYMRYKRMPFWLQRAVLGDRIDGDWVAEGAPEVVNEAHHAWVENVTGFSSN